MSGIKFHPAELILSVLVLRLVIAAFFYHPDIKSQYYHAAFFKTGIINIYEFLQFNRTRLPYSDTFNYPPLTYIFLGSWQTLSSVISGPGLDDWLSDWSDRHLYNPDLFFYLLLLKLPYFIADFLILKLLISLVSPPRRYPLALLWLFNPVSLYAIYAVGQFDIIPALMTVAALTLAPVPAAFLLGLAASFKTYPLLLIPFLLLHTRPYPKALFTGVAALAGWGLPLLPYLYSTAFRQTVFQSSLGGRIINPGFVIFYLLVLGLSWFRRRSPDLTWDFFTVTLGVLLFSRFHAQWAVWTLPFVCLLLIRLPRLYPVFLIVLFSFFAVIFLLPDQYVLLGLFTPQNPYLATIPSLVSLIPKRDIVNFLIRRLLLVSGLGLVFSTYYHVSKITKT